MKEGNVEHIKEVATEYGWFIENDKHLCPNCKK